MVKPLPLKTLLIGLKLQSDPIDWTAVDSIQELAQLAKTAGLQVAESVIQAREAPHPKFYVGKGKLEEIKTLVTDLEIQLVITDDELTPAQNKSLEGELKIKVLDRTGLILDIFAQRARTAEAHLQVELAQLKYLLPRLTRLWTHLSRLGGGIGTRGPGETQLEVDKRQINDRILVIEKKLIKTQVHRQVLRQKRENVTILTGAIVGYTNAGKSTLLNTLTQSHVLAEDALFATLDPTTKKIILPNKDHVLLTDTVGFIQKLPHQLVNSFRATLEEVTVANFLIHVVDLSNPKFDVLIKTTQALLKEIHADKIPQIYVFNKCDKLDPKVLEALDLSAYLPNVIISAENPVYIQLLFEALVKFLDQNHSVLTLSLAYNQMHLVDLFHQYGMVLEEDYADKIHLKVNIHTQLAERILSLD